MVVVNFKIVMGAEQNGPSWLVSLVGLLDGRAAATFVVLAGAGISLLSKRGYAEENRDLLVGNRTSLLKRAFFLFVIGLLYTPLWPADILHFYGIYIGIAAFLLSVSSRYLWVLVGALITAFVLFFLVLDYEHGWDWNTLAYEGFWTTDGMIRHLFFNGFHPVIPWLAFLLVGMILGRQDMSLTETRRRVLRWGLGVALAAEIASWLSIKVFLLELRQQRLKKLWPYLALRQCHRYRFICWQGQVPLAW